MSFVFIGNGRRVNISVDDSETVASVCRKACTALSMDETKCVLICANTKLNNTTIFVKSVTPGIPIIVASDWENEEEEEEEEEDFSIDLDMDRLDQPDDLEPELPKFVPHNIADLITKLKALGDFSDSQCEKALKVSYFNMDRAAAFLLADDIPEKPEIYSGDNSEMSLEEKDKEILRRLFDETKMDMPVLVQYYYACDKNEEMTFACIRSERLRMAKEQSRDNFSDDFE